jgi:citrate lyase subunit beta / citryl-CoA lyase
VSEQAPLRSLLFVPGDSERKQVKALAGEADALILDLEDSVSAGQLPAARARVAQLVGSRAPASGAPQLWVRVHAPTADTFREDLEAICGQHMPDGVVLPKVSAPAEVIEAADYLGALETRHGITPPATRLLVIATETPQGLLALPQYLPVLGPSRAAMGRLAGLTWGAEDLGAALGVHGRREPSGGLTFTFQLARSLCLLAAAALGVQAIDGVHTDFRDAEGLGASLGEARRDGFSGKLAIHPDQVAPINAAFTPSEAELEHARRVVAAFAASAGAGVASLDGQMIDRPHLLQAQRLLAGGRRARS